MIVARNLKGYARIFASLLAALLVISMLAACQQASIGGGGAKSLIKEIQSKGELRVGYATADPHSIKNPSTGQWEGIAWEVMDAWAKELKVKHVAVDTTWDGIIPGLQANKFDVAAGLNHRGRALAVTFSVPYMYDRGVFTVNKDKEKAMSWPELNRPGVKVAVMQGSAEDKGLSKMKVNVEIVRLPDQNEGRMAMLAGRVDSFLDDIAGSAKYAKENEWARLIIPEPPVILEGIAFAIRPGYTIDDLQALNIQVEDFNNMGSLAAAQAKYGYVDGFQFVNRYGDIGADALVPPGTWPGGTVH